MATSPTTPSPTDVTVLGATGGIGRAIAAALAARGHRVTGASRSGTTDLDGVVAVAADLADPVAAKQACAGAAVVVMAAQPPYTDWVAGLPGLLDNVVAGAEAAGARLVFADNLYMYAPATGPIDEDHPEHATDPKGALRRRLGERLRDAHAAGRVSFVTGRFSDYYGPAGTNSSLYMLGIGPALRGRRMRGLVDLDQPHTSHYLPDAAAGFVRLVEDDRGDGRAWVLPAAPATTQREMLALVAGATGTRRARPGVVTPGMLRAAGWFVPMLRESRSVVCQFDRPWVVDASRFEETFGAVATTPHAEAVAETVRWFRSRAADAAS